MSDTEELRPRILCVDDEPRILDGLKLTLRREYSVVTAPGGAEALAELERTPGFSVVISDMRMPAMDGAAFLARVCERWPESTRILLTGETGREAAASAVNDGQIFRFLTKPCPPDKLLAAVAAAVRQHELITAEKVLLHETLLGSIQALVDVLGLVNPVAFGRSRRIKRLSAELAAATGSAASWELEAAALLSQIGFVTLPAELVDKVYDGVKLSNDEAVLVGEAPKVAYQLLKRIPRLEPVVAILQGLRQPQAGQPQASADGATLLATVLEFEVLTARGESAAAAVAALRTRTDRYPRALVDKLAEMTGASAAKEQLLELPLRDVTEGMIILDEVRTELGTLLVARGCEVTPSFLGKARNFGPGLLAERVRVQLPGAKAAPHDRD